MPKISAKAFPSFDSAPSTQTFGHAQKHAKKRLFHTLVTILTTAFTHLFWWRVVSSAIRSLSQEKNTRKMIIKTKKWKKTQKWIFCHEHFDFEEQVKRRNQRKTTGKEQKGQRKTLKENRWEMKRGEKRRMMGWCNECPGAEINDKWVHIELIRSTMSRHAAMVKRASIAHAILNACESSNKFSFSVLGSISTAKKIKIKRNKGFFQKELHSKNNQWYFLQLLSNNKATIFCTRPEKKIDTRKSRKIVSRNAKTSKTWNRQGIRTTQWGKTWDKTQKKRGFKKSKTPFRLQKIDHRKLWICLGKKTDTEMKKKKGKEEGRREEWDQEQKREKKNELKQK